MALDAPLMSVSPPDPASSLNHPRREAQSYFEKSFHSSPALMSIARLSDGALIEVNDAFLRRSGFDRAEVIGRSTLSLGLWADVNQREEFVRRMRSAGEVRDFEAEFRNRSGETRALLLNADVFDLNGEPAMLTVAIDITDRRRRDQVQAATYQISRAVLTGGNLDALFGDVHRIIGGLMPAKNFYVALLNEDENGLTFPYFVDEHITAAPARPLANGFTEYLLATRRALLVTADELPARLRERGPYQPLEHPAALRLGAPLLLGERAIGVIALQDYHDVRAYDEHDLQLLTFVAEQTALAIRRRQAEAAVERAEQNYRSIFENALEGLYVSSTEGKFLRVNPALARMFGYAAPAQLLTQVNDIGRQIYVQPGRRDDFFRAIKVHDAVSDFESEVFRNDGTTFWISESVRVVRDPAGAISHFEGVATDITQRREAAQALQRAKDAADTASRAKSYFLASVSHELRTPLNGILGYTQILRRDPALSEKQREGINVIHESADHLLAVINDVLDLSKIEAGRIELHLSDFNLLEFAAAVERVFTPRAREKTLLFETALATELPVWVRGDEQRLRQVVYNLVGNAVKFTAQGGVVFSVTRADEPDTIRFSVSDTGPGIAAEDLDRLFEPFTQLARTTHASGTGLGLAISRSLAEKMGGRLQVETKPGRGSRFWFDVPLSAAAGAPAQVAASRRVLGYEGERKRILVVDDNGPNRAVLSAMLSPLGFELAEAAEGEAALALFATQRFELVLMDLRLPGGMDGLEITRRIRRQGEAGARVRIIAVSASAYDIDRRECFEAGCDDFLAKPFREEELWLAIERVLQVRWVLAGGGDETRTPFPPVLHAPAAAEARAIHDLATKGDVVAIRERAQALLNADPRLAPFAQGVLDLAARFKMKAIRQFVGRYLPKDSASPDA